MNKILSRLGRLSLARDIRDDDIVDQLHHFVSATAYIGLAAFFTVKKGYLPQVFCWVPAQFDKDHYKDYVNYYCWVSGLYNIPFDEEIPVGIHDRYTEEQSVIFYRWIVVVFLLQALMFKLPNLLWSLLKTKSGINVEELLKMTFDAHLVSEETRKEKLVIISQFIARWRRHVLRPGICSVIGRKSGGYITRLYLLIKILYLVNVIAQYKFISSVLGFSYWRYGPDVLGITSAGHFEDLNHFPLSALCDFEIRQLQNIHRYTVQCSLPFNVFVEKVYTFQWFTLTFLSVITAFSVALCAFDVAYNRQKRFVRKYSLMLRIPKGSQDKKVFKRFVRNHLMDDGMFALKIISNNSSEVLAFEILEIMWMKFKDLCKQRDA